MMIVHRIDMEKIKKTLVHKIHISTQKSMRGITENNPSECCALVPLTGSLNRTFFTSSFCALAELGNLMVFLCNTCFQKNLLFALLCSAQSLQKAGLEQNLGFPCSKQMQGNNAMLCIWSTCDDSGPWCRGLRGRGTATQLFLVPTSGSL